MKYTTFIVAPWGMLLLSTVGGASAFGLLGNGGGGCSPFLSVPIGGGLGCSGSRCNVFGLESSLRRARWPRLGKAPTHDPAKFVGRKKTAASTVLFAKPKPSHEEMEERKEQLRILLSLTKAEIDVIVSYDPTFLNRRDIEGAYGPKVALLKERLGINQKAAGRLFFVGKWLLDVSVETLESKIDWLQERLDLNKEQLRKIIERSPSILGLSIEENIEPSLDIIQTNLELSDEELSKVIVTTSDLLINDLSNEKFASRFSFLQRLLDIEENDIAGLRKAIMKSPSILVWQEDCIIGVQEWLRCRVGLDDATIGKLMRRRPEFMTSNISTIEGKARWIQSEFSLSDGELTNLLGKSHLLLSSEEKLETMCRFYRLTFELDDEGLKDLVMKQPNLFKTSIKDIERKLQFYSELVGKKKAKRLVIKSSNLLLVSLKNRLKPRLSEVQIAGKKVGWTEQLIQRLARRSDDLWEKYGLEEAQWKRK